MEWQEVNGNDCRRVTSKIYTITATGHETKRLITQHYFNKTVTSSKDKGHRIVYSHKWT
jgi:hypothetical protein